MSDAFFDTNILIDWLFNRPQAVAELERHDRHRISRIVWAELLAGEKPEGRDGLMRRLMPFEMVEVTEEIACLAADVRFAFRIKLLDALIYATARVNGTTLVTRNTKDFPPDMPGIRIPYTL